MLAPLDVLKLYPEHDYTLVGALESRTGARDQQPFLEYAAHRWNWFEFGQATRRTAGMLRAQGVDSGDRVAISARNHPAHALLLFACARLGAILVPINPDFGVEEARYVLNDCSPSLIFADEISLPNVRTAADSVHAEVWALGDDARKQGFLDRLANAEPHSTRSGKPDDCCVIIYTSGTTGFPKGVMHSQKSFLLAGEAFVQRMHLQPDDRQLVVLPLYHMNALFYSLSGTLAAGASLVLMPRFSASAFWQVAAETNATTTNIIEAIGTILTARDRSEYRPDHRIRAVYGARNNVAKVFAKEFGIARLLSGFGMTEVPGVTCNPFDGPQKPGSMGVPGRHPDPHIEWAQCRIVNEHGKDVPVGDVGELLVKTPIALMGYFGAPEQTRDALVKGWFKTGDLVRVDEDGWFYFVSRKKDIIRRRGENIAGAELDRVIGEHPMVLEAAAIAVPSELGEDEILVVVVPREGARLNPGDVVDWCRERLSAIKVPRYVVLAEALPHTPTHKVAKATLQNDKSLMNRAFDATRAECEQVRTGR